VECYENEFLPIDLSPQNHLQNIKLVESPHIVITGLNAEQLTHLNIDNGKHYMYSRDSKPAFEFDFPSNFRKLREFHLDGLTVNLKTMVSLLRQDTLIKLTLKHVSGDHGVIHVDLSKQSHLEILELSCCKNIEICNLNTENLEQVHIEHSPDVFMFESGLLLNARRLTELTLVWRFITQEFNVIQTLHHLEKLTLKHVDIGDNAFTVIPEMGSLKTIKLEFTNISIDTWHKFLDSLLTLHQSVEVDIQTFSRKDASKYRLNVGINPKFKVISGHANCGFCIQTNI
jgi:hypothetical protein